MKIDEQELVDAIEVITEGGSSLGVSCDDVYWRMLDNKLLMLTILEGVHSGIDVTPRFMGYFDSVARQLILAAQRAELETGL